jgi:hypothetical protein
VTVSGRCVLVDRPCEEIGTCALHIPWLRAHAQLLKELSKTSVARWWLISARSKRVVVPERCGVCRTAVTLTGTWCVWMPMIDGVSRPRHPKLAGALLMIGVVAFLVLVSVSVLSIR